jgi:hypothetical protein
MLHDDLAELQRLVRVLERHAPVPDVVNHRELMLIGEDLAPSRAEQHLRAVAALLLTLSTYLRGRARRERRLPRRPTGAPVPDSAAPPAANGARAGVAAAMDAELAAAAASYIARDLAARQLSEFTSAEGYRLARALAQIGRVGEAVEQLLAEANQIRLHPMSLPETLSRSAR